MVLRGTVVTEDRLQLLRRQVGGTIGPVTDDLTVPETLTLEQAYRAAFFLANPYVGLESSPGESLVLFHQYLQSDSARWNDWMQAVREAMRPEAVPDPLAGNLFRN